MSLLDFSDFDHPIWTVLIGAVVVAALGLLLAFNYHHFDPPRDLVTMAGVGATYFVATLLKRQARLNRRPKRGKKK